MVLSYKIKEGRGLNIYVDEGSAKTQLPIKSTTRPLYLYTKYIDPCIRFIDKSENEKCRELYSTMVDELSRKYFITNTHDTIAKGGED